MAKQEIKPHTMLAGASLWAAQKGRTFIDEQVDPKAHAIERLNQYLSANFQFFRKNPSEAFAISAIYFFGQSDASLQATYKQIQTLNVERFEANLLQISYEKGKTLNNSLPLAETIQSIMIGEIFKLINTSTQKQFKEREANLLLQIKYLIESALR
ncbi:MAG: hypothetical protein J7501_06760 [Bdellovibrio sp.]|nr:hypothetical protein [Bdellovibrio sp.]